MGFFTDFIDYLLPLPEIVDFASGAPEFAPQLTDTVYCAERDAHGTVDAVGYPFCDGVERWYVIGIDLSWAAWLSIAEII
jgi:hypothetical protein